MEQKRTVGAIDMTQGKYLPLILRFSLPILLANVFQQLYTVVDGIVVGKSISTEALAAVSVGFPITYMLTSIFLGIGLGASVLVSQHYGNRDMASVAKTVATNNTLLLLLFLPLTLLGIFTTDFFLHLLNTQADIFQDAKVYLTIYYIGLLPQFGYNLNASILQGIGDSKTPLVILIISSVLHIVLAVLAVVCFPFGVAGVAWATVISQYFSWILSIVLTNRKYPEIRIRLLAFTLDRKSIAQTLRVGLPVGFQNALYSVGMLVMQPLINGLGSVFIAGYNAAVKVDGFVYMPVISLASAITTFVAQNIGAQKLDRVKLGVRTCIMLSAALSVALCAIVIPLRTPLMYLFTDDAAVVAAGNAYLVRVIPLYIVSTLQYLYIGILRGAGQTLVPTLAALVGLWAARVPSAYLLTSHFGPDNMHWCYAIGWLMGLAILVPYYYFGKWKKGLIDGGHPTPDLGEGKTSL